MKRGRIFIYIALIIIIAVAAGAYYVFKIRPKTNAPQTAVNTPVAPQITYVDVVTAGQNIYPGTAITEAMLSSYQIPTDSLVQGLYTNKADVVGMYAKYTISQGIPITDAMVSLTAGNVNLPGSTWAPLIPQGLTAVSIPVTRLSSVAYGIRDGDYVNVIVTMLLADIDPTTQTLLPNLTATVTSPFAAPGGAGTLTATISSGGSTSAIGRTELDETLNQPLYVVPSEGQRPRMVTQTIMQKIQVLHIGDHFPLPGETTNDQLSAGASATPTPVPAGQQAAPVVVVKPDTVTLMVTPQDANTLVYLIYSGAKITLTLRNPNDQGPAVDTDAAILEYLLTQYNIPVPAKLPYSIQPRLDTLLDPKLPNDAVTTP